MFTVMHRDSQGNETLYNALNVEWINSDDKDLGRYRGVLARMKDGECVHIGEVKCGSTKDLHTPIVFVMNEAGKTVARYQL